MATRRMQYLVEVCGLGEVLPLNIQCEMGVGCDIEVPGQYAATSPAVEPMPSRHVRIVSMGSRLQCLLHTGASQINRGLVLGGDDGKRYSFTLYSSSISIAGMHSNMGPATAFLSAVMSRHQAVRQRSLVLPTFTSIPFSHRLRMIPDVPGTLCLSDALDKYLEERGEGERERRAQAGAEAGGGGDAAAIITSSDDLLAFHRARLTANGKEIMEGDLTRSKAIAVVRKTWLDMCAALPATALTTTLSAFSPSPESFAALRRNFSTTSAMQSLFGHLFTVHDRTPSKHSIALSSGALLSSDPRPTYGEIPWQAGPHSTPVSSFSQGALCDQLEMVPFRLSRNMATFITPQGICGPMAASMVAATRGIAAHNELATSFLTVLFKEELHTFHGRQQQLLGASALPSHHLNPTTVYFRATANAFKVMDRVMDIQEPPPTTPSSPSPSHVSPTTPITLANSKALSLLSQATSDDKNMHMPPTWHPWF